MNMKMEITSWIYCVFNSCSYYEKLMVSVCYCEMDEKNITALKKHIEQCPKCREQYNDLMDFTYQLNQVQDILNNHEIISEDINILPIVKNKIIEKKTHSPLFRPQLKYVSSFVGILLFTIFMGIFIFQQSKNSSDISSTFASFLSGTESAVSSYDGPLERQKDKLREIIKTNKGQSIAGQALLLLADLEYTSSEHFDEAYRLYSQLRENYPRIFVSTPEAVYRYNLLEEVKKDNFKPLYALNSALASSDNPIKQLEKIIANYPGTMVANLAVNSMIDCLVDSSNSQNSEKKIKALENLRGYLTEPTAVAQVNYVLGTLYWNQMRDSEKARTFFQSVIHSDSKQLHPLANEALTQLVSMPE